MMTFWETVALFWTSGGVIVNALMWVWLDRRVPTDQALAGGILAAVLLPLTLVFVLVKTLPYLARGFHGLYRSYFPTKVKLPKAKVIR
jgi:hypothetical protein